MGNWEISCKKSTEKVGIGGMLEKMRKKFLQ